ncbi:Gfo/Idh/MocA family oxidoreductase [Lutibacter sp. A64]|uniref:Gfo/Idh/MocA family protein n=1 Tax=Lutibacter sp. A64 TaxID=2918526 RepID=UPI001F070417|nr:Gfo/Idh/MocA family oxidoreductase [Lutibacter sp. A64]UMB53363.1 Gfo/Idh/MocA family oxidoreductase [Lutibacter sp. A64]
MSKTYNWAILGCGNIANKFATELKLLPNANLYAAASRNLENAKDFSNQFGFKKAYGSYLEMVKDPKVDVVYIATPHNFHLEHTLLCLNHKKAVLCEKAFAINSKEVREMITTSKENNTFLMEAFWVIFRPKYLKVKEIIASENLGKLKFVKSDFMFNAEFNPQKRLYNVDLGGGSLLDIGIYPIFATLLFLGEPDQIKTIPHFSPTGSEESISMLFGYKNGATAVLTSSFDSEYKNESELCFEHGILKYDRFSPDPILLIKDGKTTEIEFENGPNLGYQFEAKHVMECLDKNLKESPIIPFSLSLKLMNILDAIRKDAGIVFPNHD